MWGKPHNRTRLTYAADAIVGGVIGGVGQRMLTGVAKKMAGEFFGNVDDVLNGREKPTIVAQQPQQEQPGVFVAPAKPSLAGSIGTDNRFMLGALVGAAIALLGVLVGARTCRRSR